MQQVARTTYIRIQYLEALESGNLGALPSPAQARGFLRTYAQHLGLQPAPLLANLEVNAGGGDSPLSSAAAEEDAPPEAAVGSPQALYQEIGQVLSGQRELLGLSLLDVERETHLKFFYLQAIENGQLDAMPSPVQGRGMINNYAQFLDLDPDPLLIKFADGLQLEHFNTRGARSANAASRVRPPRSPMRRLLSADLLVAGGLIIAVASFVIWGAIRISSVQASQPPTEAAPAIVDVLIPSPSATAVLATPVPTDQAGGPADASGAEEGTPVPEPDVPITNDAPIQLHIVARERAWMRVIVDGVTEFEGRVSIGSAYTFAGQELVEVLTGSGSALHVVYNQNDLGAMGFFGEVVHRFYTGDGILLPTPTVTPTITLGTEGAGPTEAALPTETPVP